MYVVSDIYTYFTWDGLFENMKQFLNLYNEKIKNEREREREREIRIKKLT